MPRLCEARLSPSVRLRHQAGGKLLAIRRCRGPLIRALKIRFPASLLGDAATNGFRWRASR